MNIVIIRSWLPDKIERTPRRHNQLLGDSPPMEYRESNIHVSVGMVVVRHERLTNKC